MKFFERKSMPPLISIIFLFMIVSRLTWMQLRHYPIETLGFLGPSILGLWQVPASDVRSWNINTIIVLFFLAGLMIRLLMHSWMTALFAVTVLMSRGVVLARVGWMSMDLSLSMLVTGWFACLSHYLTTASPWSRIGTWLFLFLGSILEPSFAAVGLLIPIYRYCIVFKKTELLSPTDPLPRGSLLKPLSLNFHDWLRTRRHPNRDSLADLLVCFGAGAFSLFFRKDLPNYVYNESTYSNVLSFLDLHYVGSLILIAACAAYGWNKKDNFLSFQKLLLSVFALWVFGGAVCSQIGVRTPSFKAILLWMEPLILCLACACLMFIIQETRSVLAQRRWTHRVSKISN